MSDERKDKELRKLILDYFLIDRVREILSEWGWIEQSIITRIQDISPCVERTIQSVTRLDIRRLKINISLLLLS